jgi:hypothetical protein
VRAERSYFVVYPAAIEPQPRLVIFRDWLLEQATGTITAIAQKAQRAPP